MKKIIFSTIFIAFLGLTHASEQCLQAQIIEKDYPAIITTAAKVRNIACMENSEVLFSLSLNTKVRVIADGDGRLKILTKDGKIGRVGARLLSTTSPDGAPSKPTGMTTPDYYTTTYTTTDYTKQLASSLAPLLKNRADFVVEKILSTTKNKFPGDTAAQKTFIAKISQKLESLKQTKPKRETILNYIISQIK